MVTDDQPLSTLLGAFPLHLPRVQSLLALMTLSFSFPRLIQRLPIRPTMRNALLFYSSLLEARRKTLRKREDNF